MEHCEKKNKKTLLTHINSSSLKPSHVFDPHWHIPALNILAIMKYAGNIYYGQL